MLSPSSERPIAAPAAGEIAVVLIPVRVLEPPFSLALLLWLWAHVEEVLV